MVHGQLDVVLRHIHKLAGAPAGEELKDGQLLQRFAEAGEEAAFAALVRRHGPLVLGVCRRVLRDTHAAEDAFQATFLVLLRRARALDRRGSLAGWLHTVAYHVALRARARAARRQRQERQVAEMADTVSPADPVWLDLQPVLDEELGRLPETYREAVLLCFVQGKTHAEAARLLGWPVGTVKGRLARARELLRRRLGRRGISLSAGALALVLAEKAPAVVPATLLHATVSGAAAGLTSSAALSLAEGVLKTMFVSKLKIATALLIVAGLLALGTGPLADPAQPPSEKQTVTAPAPAPATVQPVLFKPPAGRRPAPAEGEVKPRTLTGRVLGSDGKPLAGARVAVLGWFQWEPRPALWVHNYGDMPRRMGLSRPRVAAAPQLLGQATTDRDGKFRVKVDWVTGRVLYGRPDLGAPIAESLQVVLAGAPGHGLGWCAVGQGDSVEIRLPAEHVVRGRLLDVQGQPVANVKLQVSRVGSRPTQPGGYRLVIVDAFSQDAEPAGLGRGTAAFYEIDAAVRLGYIHYYRQAMDRVNRGDGKFVDVTAAAGLNHGRGAVAALVCRRPPPDLPFWPKAVTTDAQGRFKLHGIGRGQGVGLQVRDERYAVQALDVPAEKAAKGAEIPLVLQPARTLEGTVTDSVTGRPVPGARLRVAPPPDSYVAFQEGPGIPSADWRGRRGRGDQAAELLYLALTVAEASAGLSELPAVEVKADNRGRFKLPLFQAGSYNVRLAADHYLPRTVKVDWPRGGVVRKVVNVTLVRGVPVRGKVTEDSGKAVAGARVDFWAKGLKLPEGVPFPRAVQTGADGHFEALLPPASWHLLVNAPKAEYVYRKVETVKLTDQPAGDLGKKGTPQPAGPTYFYPDAWQALDVKAGSAALEVSILLRRAPLLRGRVVGPDGKAVAGPVYAIWAGPHVRHLDLKDGTFAIPVNEPDARYRLHVINPAGGLGAVVEQEGKQAGAGPVTVRLARVGAVRARFLDAAGKPLANYRPVAWLVPSADFPAGAEELKALAEAGRGAPDALWPNRLHTGHYYVAGPRTDAQGRVTLANLIPGATYRLVPADGKVRDFTVRAGQTVTLPDLVVNRPAPPKRQPEPPGGKAPSP
jgi:RNA polymerase sigma factor (sigma-70 family)